jgi:predicted dehydrogenase
MASRPTRFYSRTMVVAVGLARAGRRAAEVYARALSSCDAVGFAGVWARGVDRGRSLAEQHGVPFYATFDELLEHCDAVAFALPPPAQPVYAVPAIRRGKAALLEMPIGGDLAGAEELDEAATVAHAVTQVALTWRYAAAVRAFLGGDVPQARPFGGRGQVVSGAFADTRTGSPSRHERGVLMSRGPHLVDLLDAALGPVAGERAHGDPHGWLGLELEHQGGRASHASMSGDVPVPSERASVEVYGPGGHAEVDCAAAVGADTYLTMIQEFAEAVVRGNSHELDVHRGMHLQRVLEAAETDLLMGI